MGHQKEVHISGLIGQGTCREQDGQQAAGAVPGEGQRVALEELQASRKQQHCKGLAQKGKGRAVGTLTAGTLGQAGGAGSELWGGVRAFQLGASPRPHVRRCGSLRRPQLTRNAQLRFTMLSHFKPHGRVRVTAFLFSFY